MVHLIHAADGMFPSDMACGDAESIEEERRLMYVAVTRARNSLEINVPRRYHVAREPFRRNSDRHLFAQVSRFLTPEVQALMEPDHAETSAPDDGGGLDTAASSGAVDRAVEGEGGMDSVDRYLSGLWA